MIKHCACGKLISNERYLCKECGDIYGYKVEEWPEWLRWVISDIQRVWDAERTHDEFSIYEDEYFLVKTKPKREKDFEDMFWDNQ